MIVVIADDISGAAELAGVAFERGFSAEVQTTFDPESEADVVALDTNTRLLAPDEAAARVGEIARGIPDPGATLIFKKTDSVLRGAVIPEIDAITAATGKRRTLLVPANPSRGRVIRNGKYYVDGVALPETEFAHDPTHPARSSNVLELLGPSRRGGTSSVRSTDPMFGSGVTVPDVASAEDLERRAAEVSETVLPAGGAEFFAALLDRQPRKISPPVGSLGVPARSPDTLDGTSAPQPGTSESCLMVCGSPAAWLKGRGAQAKRAGVPVFVMPESLISMPVDDQAATDCLSEWAFEVWNEKQQSGSAMIAIGRAEVADADPEVLLNRLSEAVRIVLSRTRMDRLLLEGGATARAVTEAMGWSRFETIGALGGLSWLRPAEDGPALLIKPGSYDWPEGV